MYTLAPSIYAADYMDLKKQIELLEAAGVAWLHVDIMDGHFVPSMAFGPDFLKALSIHTKLKLDVHLMIDRPERMAKEFAEAGADVITIHQEACQNLKELLKEIHSYGVQTGIVLKPDTGLDRLGADIWEEMDVLQIMTVQPGRKGQHFMEVMLDKIREARARIQKSGKDIRLEVDGGITKERLLQVVDAGADMVVVGKAIFNGTITENVKEYLALA